MCSSSGEYLLAGASNGSIRVHPLARAYSLTSLQAYWALSMHDNYYGAVTQLATTYDDQYVLSGGADGNVFVYTANLPTAAEKRKTAAAALEKVGFSSTLLWLLYSLYHPGLPTGTSRAEQSEQGH